MKSMCFGKMQQLIRFNSTLSISEKHKGSNRNSCKKQKIGSYFAKFLEFGLKNANLATLVTVIHCQPQATQKKMEKHQLIVVNDVMGHDIGKILEGAFSL